MENKKQKHSPASYGIILGVALIVSIQFYYLFHYQESKQPQPNSPQKIFMQEKKAKKPRLPLKKRTTEERASDESFADSTSIRIAV